MELPQVARHLSDAGRFDLLLLRDDGQRTFELGFCFGEFLGQVEIVLAHDPHEDLEVINSLFALSLFVEAVKDRMPVGHQVLMLEHERGKTADGGRRAFLTHELLLQRVGVDVVHGDAEVAPQALGEFDPAKLVLRDEEVVHVLDVGQHMLGLLATDFSQETLVGVACSSACDHSHPGKAPYGKEYLRPLGDDALRNCIFRTAHAVIEDVENGTFAL